MENLRNGDVSALRPLYALAQPAVVGYALSLCGNLHDAQELAQDAFLRLYAAAPTYEARGHAMAYLMTVTRNLWLDRLRKRAREAPLPDRDVFIAPETLPPEERLVLEALLDRLDGESARIVMLHAVAGLKHREIAALCRLPLSTVLSRYNRSIRKLKQWLEEEDHA